MYTNAIINSTNTLVLYLMGENVFIAGNRLRSDRNCIIDYYKGHHPFGLGGNYSAIDGSVN